MTLTIGHVEVRVEPGGWTVTVHYKQPVEPRLLHHFRLKASAKIYARGVADVLGTELRVTDRKGRYTAEAASYGNDPRDIPG